MAAIKHEFKPYLIYSNDDLNNISEILESYNTGDYDRDFSVRLVLEDGFITNRNIVLLSDKLFAALKADGRTGKQAYDNDGFSVTKYIPKHSELQRNGMSKALFIPVPWKLSEFPDRVKQVINDRLTKLSGRNVVQNFEIVMKVTATTPPRVKGGIKIKFDEKTSTKSMAFVKALIDQTGWGVDGNFRIKCMWYHSSKTVKKQNDKKVVKKTKKVKKVKKSDVPAPTPNFSPIIPEQTAPVLASEANSGVASQILASQGFTPIVVSPPPSPSPSPPSPPSSPCIFAKVVPKPTTEEGAAAQALATQGFTRL